MMVCLCSRCWGRGKRAMVNKFHDAERGPRCESVQWLRRALLSSLYLDEWCFEQRQEAQRSGRRGRLSRDTARLLQGQVYSEKPWVVRIQCAGNIILGCRHPTVPGSGTWTGVRLLCVCGGGTASFCMRSENTTCLSQRWLSLQNNSCGGGRTDVGHLLGKACFSLLLTELVTELVTSASIV